MIVAGRWSKNQKSKSKYKIQNQNQAQVKEYLRWSGDPHGVGESDPVRPEVGGGASKWGSGGVGAWGGWAPIWTQQSRKDKRTPKKSAQQFEQRDGDHATQALRGRRWYPPPHTTPINAPVHPSVEQRDVFVFFGFFFDHAMRSAAPSLAEASEDRCGGECGGGCGGG